MLTIVSSLALGSGRGSLRQGRQQPLLVGLIGRKVDIVAVSHLAEMCG